jgi:predicted transcriptional regulator YheO
MSNRFNVNPPHIGYGNVSDIHGGQEYTLNFSSEIVSDLEWVRQYRAKLDKEEQMRESTPALKNSWDSYQTMLRIVMDDV